MTATDTHKLPPRPSPALADQSSLQRLRAWALSPWALAILLGGICILGLGSGAMSLSPLEVLAALLQGAGLDPLALGLGEVSPSARAVVMGLRAPRVLLGACVGGTLALSGAALQGLFRNPLADPQLLGMSMGGAVGAALVILVGAEVWPLIFEEWGNLVIPLGAFAGSLITVILVLSIASQGGRSSTANILLAGIAFNALGGAALGLLLFFSDEAALRTITMWTLGSLGGATWGGLKVALPLMLLAGALCLREASALNALLLGEADASYLGINVPQVERRVTVAVALAVGAGVALSGVIGFVGLVVPHLYRLVAGPDHRSLLPGATLLGACLLVMADIAARTLLPPQELPTGVLTALVGGPFFIYLLRRKETHL